VSSPRLRVLLRPLTSSSRCIANVKTLTPVDVPMRETHSLKRLSWKHIDAALALSASLGDESYRSESTRQEWFRARATEVSSTLRSSRYTSFKLILLLSASPKQARFPHTTVRAPLYSSPVLLFANNLYLNQLLLGT
jgi:hypothetical protein